MDILGRRRTYADLLEDYYCVDQEVKVYLTGKLGHVNEPHLLAKDDYQPNKALK